MKKTITIALFSLAVVCLCYAKNAGWDKNQKPKISLADAHTKALEALQSRHVDYYCLAATVARTFSECDWELHFAATNNAEVWVSVGSDKVRVSEHGFRY
ncbi:MAG: hypothetical protein JWM68_2739 [Verrucomicrobiales bacterium]|nr:hypothetical protein [Verrucomicrobiales bacterium]